MGVRGAVTGSHSGSSRKRSPYSDLTLRRCVARNSKTSPAVLLGMSRDQDSVVRRGVSRNTSSSPDALAILSSDDDVAVRSGVAENAETPLFVLGNLAQDRAVRVRWSVASNPRASSGILAALARDRDAGVRRAAVAAWTRLALATPGAAELYAALGVDPLRWDEDRQRQFLRDLGEDA